MPNYSNNTKRSWMAVDLGKGRKLIPSRYCVRCVICPCTCLLPLSICLLMVRLFVCKSISVRLCGRVSLCLSICLSVCLSVCLPVCLCVCLSISVSISLCVYQISGQRIKDLERIRSILGKNVLVRYCYEELSRSSPNL